MSATPRQSIFISYKSEEFSFVAKLRASLKNAGVDVWVDKFEIQTGDDWNTRLGEGLHTSKGLIAVMTPDYFNSFVCRQEIGYAFEKKLPIYPLLLRPISEDIQNDPKRYPWWLSSRQYTNFISLDESQQAAQIEALTHLIKEENTDSVRATPDALTQYLNTLIGDLESWQGVEEYIALAAQAEQKRPDNPPTPQSLKRIDPSFAFLEKVKNKPSADNEKHEKHEIKRIPVENIHAALEMHSRFVLIGDPGAGKTTTLRRLALESAYACLDNQKLPIPFMLNLPLWPDGSSFDVFLRSQWPIGGDILELLRHNKVHLYLDGLNEMGASGKTKADLLKAWLKSEENPSQIIVTCRQNDYLTGDLKLDVATVLVEPLDDAAIKAFAEKYLGEGYERFLEKIFTQEKSQRSLLHLARNPYLLSALILVYSAGGELPRNTGALFQQLVYALWERERLRNTPNWIPLEEMQERLGRLAFAMIDKDWSINVRIAYLELHSDIQLLKVAQSASLITMSANTLHFSHQLILEYFAAVKLKEKKLETVFTIPKLEWTKRRRATKWDEVIIAYVGIIGNANKAIQQIVDTDIYLAAKCVGSGVRVKEQIVFQLIFQLNIALTDKNWWIRSAAAQALGWIADPIATSYLINALDDENEEVIYAAAQALGQIAGSEATSYLINVLTDKSWWIRRAAAQALRRIDTPEAHAALVALENYSENSPDELPF